MNESRIHQAFEIGVPLKGAHALVECFGGLALYLAPSMRKRISNASFYRRHECGAR